MNAFTNGGEVDVREDLVAPLLKQLGYARNTKHNLLREMPLRYPQSSIGRKKKSDPPLLGFADYVLEADGKVRWTVETKPPEPIKTDDIEQAFSYARHPEVNGQYFVLCNGIEFVIYQTAHAPASAPLLCLPVEELQEKFVQVAAILSPDALLRDFPSIRVDFAPPLAPGMRSIGKVLKGFWVIDTCNPLIPPIVGINIAIESGVIQRYDDLSVGIVLNTRAPFQQLQEVNEVLGFAQAELKSSSQVLSTLRSQPTVFEMDRDFHFPAGTQLCDLSQFKYVTNEAELFVSGHATASAVLEAGVLSGSVITNMCVGPVSSRVLVATLKGRFSMHVA